MTLLIPRFVTVALRSTCRHVLRRSRPLTSEKHHTQYTHVRNLFATRPQHKDKITVYFVTPDGEKLPTYTNVDSSLLDTVIDNGLDIDGFGACEGTMACSTCHLILPKELYDAEHPSDEEQDLLDMAYGLTDTSRLGCQVYVTKEMDGLEIKIPTVTEDIRGFS